MIILILNDTSLIRGVKIGKHSLWFTKSEGLPS